MFRVPNHNQYCFCLSSARFWYWWCDDDFGKCLWQNVCLGIQSVVCQSWFTENVNITHCFKPWKTDAYLQWLRRLYAQRSGSVRANNFVLDIKREVKQGDALSPILFFHVKLGWTIQNWKQRMVSCWARWAAGSDNSKKCRLATEYFKSKNCSQFATWNNLCTLMFVTIFWLWHGATKTEIF